MIQDKALYNRSYFMGHYSHDYKRENMYKAERRRITNLFPQGGNILDIGCGVGGFLSGFPERWRKYGVEPSDFAREKATQAGIKIGELLDFVQGSFDVIILRGVLQHINFPMETLAHAERLLKPGGMIVILATPDTDGIVYKIFGKLPALDADRNWILFGNKMLCNILQRLGFTDLKVLHPYSETPYARPFMDFMNLFISLFFGWRPFAFPGNMMEIYGWKK